ncbi:MAG: thermonuclease family protein [Sulfurimonas sp.]|uniref:thermonuclease family protein n=1 Tax=Sulfurimonas sp. TaxID=2022749 RepID=UPI0025CF0E12|nr:thermonuclease family protein [Sulfurimonas sp.]MCK9492237.1 thermonuclease family protein [Sulfurimonas sp.]
MLKKTKIFITLILLSLSLNAKEPLLGILTSVNSNEIQSFNISKCDLTCRPYGVLTLERLYEISEDNSVCREKIRSIYAKDPNLKHFAQRLLEVQQRYHIRPKEKGECVLYAKGQLTLSELLLAKGLALVKPLFDDKEFRDDFSVAERRARLDKRGLWMEEIFEICAAKLYE